MPVKVSVCMATYNGARFVAHQLRSVLDELDPGDEVVVVDDASTDGTAEIVAAFDDPRVHLHRQGENLGYVRTFERALALATGDVLFLSDQDDEWIPGRRAVLLEALAEKSVAASDLVLLGGDRPLPRPFGRGPWRLVPGGGGQRRRNELRVLAGIAPYFGCTMAIERDFLPVLLPFPAVLTESHDLWIALAANRAGELAHVSAPTLRRRLHEENASPLRPRGLRAVLRSRLMLLRLGATARRRARTHRTATR